MWCGDATLVGGLSKGHVSSQVEGNKMLCGKVELEQLFLVPFLTCRKPFAKVEGTLGSLWKL